MGMDLARRETLAYCVIKLNEEAGEAASPIAKALYQGHQENPEKVKDELGDLLFYLTWIAKLNGYSLTDIMAANIAKRQGRYPEGFDPQRSINRG
jgi:NTP pyrophosphatase (non-canonical NTP hydrolase)